MDRHRCNWPACAEVDDNCRLGIAMPCMAEDRAEHEAPGFDFAEHHRRFQRLGFSSGEVASAIEEFHRRLSRDRSANRHRLLIDLLGQWISEVEPVIWIDSRGQITGIGTAERIIISAPGHELRKVARETFADHVIQGIASWPAA